MSESSRMVPFVPQVTPPPPPPEDLPATVTSGPAIEAGEPISPDPVTPLGTEDLTPPSPPEPEPEPDTPPDV